jgi:acyl carrier protein
MNRDEFYEVIATEFGLDVVPMDEMLLASDLGLDSLSMFDLVLFIEEVAEVPAEDRKQMDYPMLSTSRDAYAYYEALRVPSDSTPREVRIG